MVAMKLVLETNHNRMYRPLKRTNLRKSASRAVARVTGWRTAHSDRPIGGVGAMMILVNVDPEAGTSIESVLVTGTTLRLGGRTTATVVDARTDATTTTTTDVTVVVTRCAETTNAGGTTDATHAIDRSKRIVLDSGIPAHAPETIGAGRQTGVTAVADGRQDELTRTAMRD